MAKSKLPDTATKIFELLEPLDPNDRTKVVQSAFALLGAVPPDRNDPVGTLLGKPDEGKPQVLSTVQSRSWMTQNEITPELVQEVFHLSNRDAQIIVSDVPGNSKREKTRNCYLLTGIGALLATGAATFQDSQAVRLCKHFGCYDSANHAGSRDGIKMTGNKSTGFTLAAPALREGATLLKELAQ
jgi:hypothetical protein